MLLRNGFLLVAWMCVASIPASAQRLPSGVSNEDLILYARLLAMTDTRRLDTTLIERALTSRWRTLRAAAALSIGQVGLDRGRAGVPILRGLLSDRDSTVASNAAYALGLLRDTAEIGVLQRKLASTAPVSREAAWALGEIGAPARSVITGALKGAARPDALIQLLLASAKLRPVPTADIEPFLHNRNPSVVWAAAYAIARTRAPAGVSDLLALEASPTLRENESQLAAYGSSGPYVNPTRGWELARAEIARGIAKPAAGDSLGPKALIVLSRLVGDRDPHVRINAVRSIATYGAVAKAALIYATRDIDPNVRVAAAQSFGTVLTANATEFSSLWAADTSVVYRSSLLASAVHAGLRPQALTEWAGNPDWRLRAAVASAEGDTLDRAFAFSRAAPLTRDADPRVREAAYAALSPSAGMPLEDTVHSLLIQGLADPDFYVRATIIGALADRPSRADLPAVLASYDSAARDSANDARLAAVQYIAALWKKDSALIDGPMQQRLAARHVPSDPLERTAGETLPFWKRWSDVPGVAKPIGFYEGIVRSMVIPASSGKMQSATIYTVRGPIHIELFGDAAPLTVANFLTLARSGYYRNTRFHRVVPNFVAQDGDPRDDGNGGPGYAIRDEMNPNRYERGAVGMALSGPNTGGSQYFITHSPQPHLDGHYTVFGRVTTGLDVLDKIVQGDRITRVDAR